MSQPFGFEDVDRAEYGVQTLKRLSAALKEKIGRGFSERSPARFRRFYLEFQDDNREAGEPQALSVPFAVAEPPQTLSAESPVAGKALSTALRSAAIATLQRLALSWSHYATLLPATDAKTPLPPNRGSREPLECP